ncbi:AraC family transcriptional regulator [Streptomyces sp. WAC07149]|nr:AraC family transcriptional regulator [Streptomyces sp. WAC07149]
MGREPGAGSREPGAGSREAGRAARRDIPRGGTSREVTTPGGPRGPVR